MNNIPFRVVSFDDTVTLAMGEAFDRARKSFRNFGSAAPAIIAGRIIEAAKHGERDPDRLYEQVLKDYRIDDTLSRDLPLPQPMLRSQFHVRSWGGAVQMSAFDPKRTSPL